MRPAFLALAALALTAFPPSSVADEIAHLLPPDMPAGLSFGTVLAQEPGLLVVGCPLDSTLQFHAGSIYIFTEQGGAFAFQQKIDSPVPVEGTNFGTSVDVDAGRIVVGSRRSTSSNPDRGWVHVFEPSGSTWALTATLVPAAVQPWDSYGESVRLEGDVLLAAAPNDGEAGLGAGAVYVHREVAGAWVLDQKLLPTNPAEYAGFGSALELDGDTAVIGRAVGSSYGWLHVYVDSGMNWAFDGTLQPDELATDDDFGYGIGVQDGTIVVGASRRDGGEIDTGAAFVFEKQGGSWVESAFLKVPGARPADQIGRSVALDGDRLLLGARSAPTRGHRSGAAHLFERDGSTWSYRERLVPCGLGHNSQAGAAVSIAGEFATLGGPGWTVDTGEAWVFDLGGSGGNECADAQTWFVDAAGSPPGSGTAADPYTDIAHALAQPETTDGDTLLVLPGEYSGGFQVSKSVTIRSQDGAGMTTLDVRGGDEVWLDAVGPTATVLDGFTILGPASNGRSLRFDQGWLRDSILFGEGGTGLLVHDYTAFVTRCVIAGHAQGANVSHGFSGAGDLHCWSSIFWGNDDDIESNFDPQSARIYNSLLRAPGPNVTLIETIDADPLFHDAPAGDFHLRAGSPCIDTGVEGGAPDPDGSRADMGTFAFDAGYHPEPQIYCIGAPNSAGAGARIDWTGSPSVGANDFTLVVTGSAPNQYGKFYYGPNLAELPFGDGFRCVGPGSLGIFRLYPAQTSDSNGSFSRLLDFDAPPAGSGPGSVLPGSGWSFQYWYRDPQGPGGSGFNLSDALRVVFAL